MLCKEKRYATRTGAAVVAACGMRVRCVGTQIHLALLMLRPRAGLFVDPLLAAVPIDKQFDMYKPSGGRSGRPDTHHS